MAKPAAKSTDRRGKVTDEHREEAGRLKAIWLRTKDQREAAGVGTQEKFGAEFEIGNQAAVGFFLNGQTALSFKAASGFARGLKCRIGDFSPRLAALGEAGEPQPAGGPSSDMALRLANAFAAVPDDLGQDFEKVTLYNHLLAEIRDHVRRAKAAGPAVHPSTTAELPAGRRTTRAKARAGQA